MKGFTSHEKADFIRAAGLTLGNQMPCAEY